MYQSLRRLDILIFAGILATKLLLYVFITPPWQVPDEPTHFEYAYLLYREKTLLGPVQSDLALQKDILESMESNHFWSFLPWDPPETIPTSFKEDRLLHFAPSQINRSPPLYYAIGSLWLRLFSPRSILEALFILRIYSALQTLLFFFVLALLVHWILPRSRQCQIAALSLAVFLPQLSFIGAGVNSDNTFNLCYAATTAVCVMFAVGKRPLWMGPLLVLSVVACLLSKTSGLLAVPLMAFTVLAGLGWNRRRLMGSVCVGTALLLALILGQAVLTWISPDSARKIVVATHFGWTRLTSFDSIGGEQSLTVTASLLWRSFWAVFGWLTVALPGWLYLPNLAILFTVAVGAIKAFTCRLDTAEGDGSLQMQQARLIVSLSGLLLLIAVILRNVGEFQPQGRYLLAGLPAFGLWFAAGITLTPMRGQRWLIAAFLAWLCLFDLSTLIRYAIPAFYLGAS